jgi:hypothetical protein
VDVQLLHGLGLKLLADVFEREAVDKCMAGFSECGKPLS